MKSNEIAHKWAHQLNPNGKCPSSMSFNGPSFYSYSTEIARIVTHKGKTGYLLNDTSYSNSTSKHQHCVRMAIPTDVILRVAGVDRGRSLDITPAAMIDYSEFRAAEIASRFSKCKRDTTRNGNLMAQSEWIANGNKIAEFYGLKRRLNSDTVAKHGDKIKRAEARDAKLRKAELIRREIAEKQYIESWVGGADIQFPYGVDRVYLRATGDNLETSKGVTVALTDAKRAFQFAQRVKATGWHRNGDTFKVGDYQLDAVNENGIVAGCHRIGWDEIERFATAQGWSKPATA